MIEGEQPEVETIAQEPVQQGLDEIFNEGLERTDAPAEGTEPAVQQKEQVVTDTPFLELVISDAEKRAFKSEEEFNKFLDSNKVLKDGWMQKADYTRKSQEVSKQRQELELKSQEELKVWGEVPPDPASKSALAAVWQVYQKAPTPEIQEQIQNFVKDVQLLAKGQQPVGPLKQAQGSSTASPEVAALEKKITGLEQQLKGFQGSIQQREQQAAQAQQAKLQEESDKMVDDWVLAKEKSGVKIQDDEFGVMSDLMSIMDNKGQPKYTLDQAHNLALAHLGRSQVAAIKSVVKTAKQLNGSTSRTPISRASATKEPAPKTLDDIFQQGLEKQK